MVRKNREGMAKNGLDCERCHANLLIYALAVDEAVKYWLL